MRFAEKVLGLSLYPWQERALMSIALASGRCAPLVLGRPLPPHENHRQRAKRGGQG